MRFGERLWGPLAFLPPLIVNHLNEIATGVQGWHLLFLDRLGHRGRRTLISSPVERTRIYSLRSSFLLVGFTIDFFFPRPFRNLHFLSPPPEVKNSDNYRANSTHWAFLDSPAMMEKTSVFAHKGNTWLQPVSNKRRS